MNLLVINSTYTSVDAALISSYDTIIQSVKHTDASVKLLPMIDGLLNNISLKLHDLDAIAVNQGPGPFTTVRSVIATVNGLGFATHLPLIPVNGIESFVHAHNQEPYQYTIALLNAFCNDVYYAQLEHATGIISSGCCSITYWLKQFKQFLQHYPNARIKFIGNGCIVYRAEIAAEFGADIIPSEGLPEAPDIHAIIATAVQQWHDKQGFSHQIIPLYFKAYIPKN